MYLFEETQRFRQWWLWLLLVAICVREVYLFLYHNGHHPVYRSLGVIVAGLVTVLFRAIKLETKIDGTGIQYRFFPVQLSYKKIDWSEVAEAYVRKYSALGEFGGYGIRISGGRNGWAYNTAGNKGLQIVKKSGKKVLFGTQKEAELNELLERLKKDGLIAAA